MNPLHFVFELCTFLIMCFFAYTLWRQGVGTRLKGQESALEGMTDALNVKSPYYSDHSKRVSLIANAICDAIGIHGEEKNQIIQAAKLHDIGKLFVDEEILHRDGKLTDEEWDAIKLHPVKGSKMAINFGIKEPATTFILYHHENLDGSGYPLNLVGENIPRGARVLRVADSIDAMAMLRPYRQALSFEEIEKDLKSHQDTWYDKEIVTKVTNGLCKRIKLIILNNS